jgi:hydrogenase expression/formation protein HypE
MQPTLVCPVPSSNTDAILMAHGGGGRLTQRLLESVFYPAFANPQLDARHDGAVVTLPAGIAQRLAFTTDCYVVKPLFFPGGDIGSLAVNGTVNDLAMCGARPLYLSAGFILEEGLALETLRRVVQSMRAAADAASVCIVTGDTKVVERGKCDCLYVTTAGVGVVEHEQVIAPASVQSGDTILLSGDVGRHGMAIMALREGLEFETPIVSDCAPVAEMVLALLAGGVEIHCLRDLTRGGLASAVVEIATTARRRIHLVEKAIPIAEEVRGACELLGLDPLHVANEGRFIAFVPEKDSATALAILRRHRLGENASYIGVVEHETDGLVTVESLVGACRILDLLTGESLPRIC